MSEPHDARREIVRAARALAPRLLTQADRDPLSDEYGCFDRNYWHYHIRDFPSIILQQGALGSRALADVVHDDETKRFLVALARSGAKYWNARALRYGAFEEYYPYERGYPPLAFSTLAVGLLIRQGAVPHSDVERGMKVAAGQLLDRFEAEAGNQQVAGMAALAMIRDGFPGLVDDDSYRRVVDRTFALQTDDGWFPEYGGPDLGYLSVAVDCLWDYHDATADDRALNAITRAIAFIGDLIGPGRSSLGMHNSRNTDYIVPYGMARTAGAGLSVSPTARRLFDQLYGDIGPEHFLSAMDDRYLTHYLGTSLFRAAALLSGESIADWPAADPVPARVYYPGSGQLARHFDGGTLRASLAKGGIIGFAGDPPFSDFGVSVLSGRNLYVSHWWSDKWDFSETGNGFVVRGHLVKAPRLKNSPVRHTALRMAAGVAGHRLIGALKDRMIFADPESRYEYERRVEITGAVVRIRDEIGGVSPGDRVLSSPRSSRRHVSSADSYHREDTLGVGPSLVVGPGESRVVIVTEHPLIASSEDSV